jgi:hypothetical protein
MPKISGKKLKKATKKLNVLYDKIPDTKGCMENIDKEGGCEAWCCLFQNPSVLYVEFRNSWSYILKSWELDQIVLLIRRSIENYLSHNLVKGCIFFDKEGRLCEQHQTRPYNCLLPDTWVMTVDGPKYIKNIMAGDFVLSHDGKYHRVLTTASRMHNGYIYGIKPQGSHVLTWSTANHKWMTSRQKDKRKIPKTSWRFANNLIPKSGKSEGDYLAFPKVEKNIKDDFILKVSDYVSGKVVNLNGIDRIEPHTSGSKTFVGRQVRSVPINIEVDDEFLFMIGIYLAEGYSSSQSTSFCMNINEKAYLDRIATLLDRYDIPYHFKSKRNNLVLRVDSSIYSRLMKNLCGFLAENKRLHRDFFKSCSQEQLYKIFIAWSIGDGRKENKTVKYDVATISEELAIQMQQILLINNIYPRIKSVINKNRPHNSYYVVVNRSSLPDWHPEEGQGSKIMYDDHNIYTPLNDIEFNSNYNGPVYDLQIEDAESFVTTSGIVHNCRIYGITPEEEFQPRYERLKVLYEKKGEELRDQCDLVSTIDGKNVTKKHIDKWWDELVDIEASLGFKKEEINDSDGGTYRTFHDHLLIHLFPEDTLASLTFVKTNGSPMEKLEAVVNFTKILKKRFEHAEQSKNN